MPNPAKNTDELTIIGHGPVDKCLNEAVGAKALTDYFSSQGVIEGAWNAFKWSTNVADNNVETQGLKCTIGLSKDQNRRGVYKCYTRN